MKHVIFDCDNTLGVKDCDVDDGLALLYLLGCEEVTVHHRRLRPPWRSAYACGGAADGAALRK